MLANLKEKAAILAALPKSNPETRKSKSNVRHLPLAVLRRNFTVKLTDIQNEIPPEGWISSLLDGKQS
jgi:hypothetical protein